MTWYTPEAWGLDPNMPRKEGMQYLFGTASKSLSRQLDSGEILPEVVHMISRETLPTNFNWSDNTHRIVDAVRHISRRLERREMTVDQMVDLYDLVRDYRSLADTLGLMSIWTFRETLGATLEYLLSFPSEKEIHTPFHGGMEVRSGGYTARTFISAEEMENAGERNRHCIGSYAKEAANPLSLCGEVFYRDRSVACFYVELFLSDVKGRDLSS